MSKFQTPHEPPITVSVADELDPVMLGLYYKPVGGTGNHKRREHVDPTPTDSTKRAQHTDPTPSAQIRAQRAADPYGR